MRCVPLMAAVLSLCVVFVAGCGEEKDDDGFGAAAATSSSSSVSDSPSPTETLTGEQQEVLAALDKFWKECTVNVEKDPANARRHLEPCIEEGFLEFAAAAYANKAAAGARFEGGELTTYIPLPPQMGVPQPDQATVRSCNNSSRYRMIDSKTGKILTQGSEHESVEVVFVRTSEVWKVTKVSIPEDQKAYCND